MLKNKMHIGLRKIICCLVVLIIIIILAVYFFMRYALTCKNYSCLVFPNKNLWTLEDTYRNENNVWSGMFSYNDYKIRLYDQENVSSDEAQNFIKTTRMKIIGLFDTATSPYAGAISDKITCAKELIPAEEDFTNDLGLKVYFISSYLNDRLEYGACTENQIKYKVYSGMFYCENTSQWFHLELISPLNSELSKDYFKSLFLKAGCQRPSINTGRLVP